MALLVLCGSSMLALQKSTVNVGRRAVVTGTTLAVARPRPSAADAPPGFSPAELRGGARVEGIGGGADILSNSPLAVADIYYPPSLIGLWKCERRVTSIEGDAAQAEGAWKLLGGYGDVRRPESYELRYIPQQGASMREDGRMVGSTDSQAVTGTDGRRYFGVILDRGFEVDSRVHGAVVRWDIASPDLLSYERTTGGPGGAAELRVVERSVEPPGDKGWGSNELVRITTAASSVFGKFEINYATRVQRRFRRGTTDSGARLVEGLEIVKTYRVLDGVAGVEMPTSTMKSFIRLTRPT